MCCVRDVWINTEYFQVGLSTDICASLLLMDKCLRVLSLHVSWPFSNFCCFQGFDGTWSLEGISPIFESFPWCNFSAILNSDSQNSPRG